jgi:LuxR family maltose regulon positive regulatory protein
VNVAATIAIFRAYLAELRGDAEATAAYASRAQAEVGRDESMLGFITQGHLATADWLRGRLEDAERALSTSVDQWRSAGHRNLVGWGSHHLAQVQRALGRLDAAQETYRQTLAVTEIAGQPTLPAAGIAYAGLAEIAYQRNDLAEARRLITAGIVLCRQFTYTPPLATALATLAWIRQANFDTDGAREAMGEAERVSPGPAVADLLNSVPAQRARLLLAQGDVAAAERWTRERGLDAVDEPAYPKELGHLVLARVLLAKDRADQALPLLERLLTAASAQRRIASVIELHALRALAFAAQGEDDAAVDALAEALTLGGSEGYVRVFVDEGAPMRDLLDRLVATQRNEHAAARAVPLDYLARLLRAFDENNTEQASGRGTAAIPGLIGSLTAREVEVLGLMAAGRSNRRIADELVITLDTVKKHVSHILDKLGAANRTAAVTRGRQLGLVD